MSQPIQSSSDNKSSFLSVVTDAPAQNGVNLSQEDIMSPLGSKLAPNPFLDLSHRPNSFEVKEYFVGPRDTMRHSKWPRVLQIRGSITPELIVPLLAVASWTTLVTVFSILVHNVGVSSVLTTITGFVVGLGLSFRSATAYERYIEGRKFWAQVTQASQCLARIIWIQVRTPPNSEMRELLLRRASCINMLLAFAVALKHKLRFEPYSSYHDLTALVGHMPSFAQAATNTAPLDAAPQNTSTLAAIGQYLGISFAYQNPRLTIKQAQQPLGNLPLEILSYLFSNVERMIVEGQIAVAPLQALAYANLSLLSDAMVGTDRVLTTPLPIAYSIAINQITWVYIFLLPFQLLPLLSWVTIPATVAAAYIILGILFIGAEIENPFGNDTNDLPLDTYCKQIANELDIITSHRPDLGRECCSSDQNLPLFPISSASYATWLNSSEEKIRDTISSKHYTVCAAQLKMSHLEGRASAWKMV